jgi:hypothetical protein
MARKVNPLTILGALEKFRAAIPEGFKVQDVSQYETGARLALTADAALVRATFPAARSEATYTPGEQRIEGSAEIYDGETRLTLTVSGTETVPTAQRWIRAEGKVDLYAAGVWHAETGRRLWSVESEIAHVTVRVSDLPALRAALDIVSETEAEATV